MQISWIIIINCAFLVKRINPAVSEGSSTCCLTVLSNSSVNYTLNDTECMKPTWNQQNVPITDEDGNVNKEIVLSVGLNWIVLKKNYTDIDFTCGDQEDAVKPVHCTGSCISGADLLTDVPKSSPSVGTGTIIIFTIILTTVCIGTVFIIGIVFIIRRRHAANRRQADNRNHDNVQVLQMNEI